MRARFRERIAEQRRRVIVIICSLSAGAEQRPRARVFSYLSSPGRIQRGQCTSGVHFAPRTARRWIGEAGEGGQVRDRLAFQFVSFVPPRYLEPYVCDIAKLYYSIVDDRCGSIVKGRVARRARDIFRFPPANRTNTSIEFANKSILLTYVEPVLSIIRKFFQ